MLEPDRMRRSDRPGTPVQDTLEAPARLWQSFFVHGGHLPMSAHSSSRGPAGDVTVTFTATGSPATWVGAVSTASPRQVVPAAEALGPNAQAVDFFQQLRLQGGVEGGSGLGWSMRTEESVLGHGGHFVKGAADAHPTPQGTGVGAGLLCSVHHKAPGALHPSAGLSMASRLMFSEPKPLGATVMVHLFPGTSRRVMAGGVVPGVYPPQGSATMDLRR